MILFTDTHCHIHDPEFFPDGGDGPYKQALEAGIHRVFCVGTDIKSSKAAVSFCAKKDDAYAVVGIHPHEAEKELFDSAEFFEWCRKQVGEKLVGIGEIGLDYHYNHSPRDVQIALLERQLDLAVSLNLPVSFHVRDAFEDFWPIFGNFHGLRGVLHSFTDTLENMERGVSKELFIGVNGIATFAHDRDEVTKAIPLNKLLFETDAPFLTPAPLRGKVNVPGNVALIASYVAELRGITVEELSQAIEQNVARLFF